MDPQHSRGAKDDESIHASETNYACPVHGMGCSLLARGKTAPEGCRPISTRLGSVPSAPLLFTNV